MTSYLILPLNLSPLSFAGGAATNPYKYIKIFLRKIPIVGIFLLCLHKKEEERGVERHFGCLLTPFVFSASKIL